MTFNVACELAAISTPKIREMRYATWKEKNILTEREMKVIEKRYPSKVITPVHEALLLQARGEEPLVPEHRRGGCCGR